MKLFEKAFLQKLWGYYYFALNYENSISMIVAIFFRNRGVY